MEGIFIPKKFISHYKDLPEEYIMLPNPKPFSEHFKNDNYDMVQVISIEPVGLDIRLTFVGQFSWINRELKSDGGSYNKDVLVVGYKEWWEKCEEGYINGIIILVGDNWRKNI